MANLFQIPDCGLLCDLLWSDPDKDITGWSENDRGVSFTFGPDVVSRFLQKHDMDLICRAHQVVEDGYEFFSKRQLVTLFSAPNYCGEFDNAGAMMSVDESLLCSFQVRFVGVYRHVAWLTPRGADPQTCREEAKVRVWQICQVDRHLTPQIQMMMNLTLIRSAYPNRFGRR